MFVPRKKHGRSAGYGTAGSAPALSRARRKTSGRKKRSKSIGLTPHLPALSLPEDPSHTVLRRELEERLERKIAGP